MKNIGDRISFKASKIKTTVVIVPERNFLVNALMGAWLGMWYCIGGTVIWSLYELSLTEQERIILYIFLVFWFYYAFRISKAYLWLIFGRELLKLDRDGFHIKNSFFSYGKLRTYYYGNIKELDFDIPEKKTIRAVWESSPWVSGGEIFEFEYFGKLVKFGRKLTLKEGKLLFDLLKAKIKIYSK
tara:strand:- start:3979 stop:4533 length:555 start_codon:yes stop_codon:yes gene_type:complete